VTVTTESDTDDEQAAVRTFDALSADRRRKRDVLADQGIDPYPVRFDRTATAAELHHDHQGLEPGAWPVSAATAGSPSPRSRT
jgi:lysyl-tRNA synthetase class II